MNRLAIVKVLLIAKECGTDSEEPVPQALEMPASEELNGHQDRFLPLNQAYWSSCNAF